MEGSFDADPALNVAASSMTLDLGTYPISQYWRFNGWYVNAGDVQGKATELVSETGYAGINKLVERHAPDDDSVVVHNAAQALFYR